MTKIDIISGFLGAGKTTLIKKLIKEAVERDDYEEAKDLMEQLEEINEWTDCDGLLVLSMNNGMGFTCRPYQPKQSRGERA